MLLLAIVGPTLVILQCLKAVCDAIAAFCDSITCQSELSSCPTACYELPCSATQTWTVQIEAILLMLI